MLKFFLLWISLAWSAHAVSAIQILATRVIVNEKENEQSFTIRNTGDAPSLVQLWLSEKNDISMKISDNVPLILTPPVARINAQKSKVFRIFLAEDAKERLPKDRESVFWINALDVPAVDESEQSANRMDIAFRTRIKLFYRPAGISGTLIAAGEGLSWTPEKVKNDLVYSVTNRSPFHVSLANLYLEKGDKQVAQLSGEMVDPYSTRKLTFKNINESEVKLRYQYITDLGAFVDKKLQ